MKQRRSSQGPTLLSRGAAETAGQQQEQSRTDAAQSPSRRNRQAMPLQFRELAGNETDTAGRAANAMAVGDVTKYMPVAFTVHVRQP